MTKLQEIWQNRVKIAEGIYNYTLGLLWPTKASKVAKNRITKCRSNACGLYDKYGESEKAFIKGQECCAGCGCVLKFLTSSMESSCTLKELGQVPMWVAEK